MEAISGSGNIRQQIIDAIAHFEHILPGQAPIKDFVHHNTLHGFQHLTFPEALAEAHKVTGNYGYLPAKRFREYLQQGRITKEDLLQILDSEKDISPHSVIAEINGNPLLRRDVFLAVLIHSFEPLTQSQLTWQVEEMRALKSLQPDLDKTLREQIIRKAKKHEIKSEAEVAKDLWNACLVSLGLQHFILHPEEMVDLSPEIAEQMLSTISSKEESDDQQISHRLMQHEAAQELMNLFDEIGLSLTLRDLLENLTGIDILDDIRPFMVRHLGSWLDQGVAAWHHNDSEQGFYKAWLHSATKNHAWIFDDLEKWRHHLESLPEEPLEVVIDELRRLGLPRERWISYLERLALELPGWSGMFLWRHLHPGYEGLEHEISMLDYLAVRLVIERIFSMRLCANTWQVEPSIDVLRWYFRHHLTEYMVRYSLYSKRLPEYLVSRAQQLIGGSKDSVTEINEQDWQDVAHLIWTWQQSPSSDHEEMFSVHKHAWPLFRLVQHLGMDGADVRELGSEGVRSMLDCLSSLDEEKAGFIWLRAYENHYRDELFTTVVANHGRGRWPERKLRPEAQLVFCMDDREEGYRRHLEEHNPAIETLGAAAHFGVPNWWLGLDDDKPVGLCPVVMVPSHEVREQVMPGNEERNNTHIHRRIWRLGLRNYLHQEVRRNLIKSTIAILVSAPVALLALSGKVIAPRLFGQLASRLRNAYDLDIPTSARITAEQPLEQPSPNNVQLGFSTPEQAERVGNFLKTMGLRAGFAPLVVIMGHGSESDNNPHIAAYNCGACSGNHSGPNARIFAAMANRSEVRAALRERNIDIPDDCWFIGAEHNTCDETITWYDLDKIPEAFTQSVKKLQQDLEHTGRQHAHERCRKFFSAPHNPSPQQALNHVIGRGLDFSQARPELGHATNAAAFIGRRSMSQGAFWDRRVFLISYDPHQDPDGAILEPLLLANGPVGAGINLEYYFSTVNNEGYGCGSKVTHNVTGFFGIMQGANSDLRTGLPSQMIEIHEAMRLLILVEAKLDVLTAIYQRQPPLQELIGNGWLLLAAKDPESPAIHVFDTEQGWMPWQAAGEIPQTVARSSDWYPGTPDPLAPVLIDNFLPEARHA